eukprot:g25590.t1
MGTLRSPLIKLFVKTFRKQKPRSALEEEAAAFLRAVLIEGGAERGDAGSLSPGITLAHCQPLRIRGSGGAAPTLSGDSVQPLRGHSAQLANQGNQQLSKADVIFNFPLAKDVSHVVIEPRPLQQGRTLLAGNPRSM